MHTLCVVPLPTIFHLAESTIIKHGNFEETFMRKQECDVEKSTLDIMPSEGPSAISEVQATPLPALQC